VDNLLNKGQVKGISGGSAGISADWTSFRYSLNHITDECDEIVTSKRGSGTDNVHSVQVTSVNLPADQVSVTLSGPSGASGQLVVTWNGPGGNAAINNNTRSVGSYTFNPPLGNLVSGQYTGVTAQWTVNGVTASGSKTSNFRVLGTYTQTQYNTPAESQCSGSSGTAYLTTGPTSCPWSTISLISQFITQAWINGSGATINYDLIQEYLAGCSPPQGGNQNYFRRVGQVTPACGGQGLSDTTVAADFDSTNHPLSCGDSVLIVGLGGGVGTVKTVTDKCPACTGQAHIDNYNTGSACSLSTLPGRMTIRINR
jgi:hypothetical protein